ncbi:MAG: type II secretion system protein [Patescibacteria group bacterium]
MIFNFKIKNNKGFTHTPKSLVSGFTLVEMLVAVAMFTLIAVFALGSVLSIFDANKKAQASKTVVDNLNLSIENMARTIRFGDHYWCGTSSVPDSVYACPSGANHLSVKDKGGDKITYGLGENAIQISINGGTPTNITSSDTTIDYLHFYVFNSWLGSADNAQPYIKAVIKGHVGTKSTERTDFSIETLISQRALDL